MINTLIAGLLPVIFTICLGYFASSFGSFDKKAPAILNKAVMSYAVPLALFIQLNQLTRDVIFQNFQIFMWLFIIIIGWWFIVFLINRFVVHATIALSSIRALSISTPAILFVGPALLPLIYPETANMTISLGGLAMCIALPITFIFLASTKNSKDKSDSIILSAIWNGIKNPIVVGEIVGIVTALLNLHLPAIYVNTFTQLGKAGAGLGLFTIGISLQQFKPEFTKVVWLNVLSKEIVVPLSAFLLLSFTGQSTALVNEITLTMMISEIIFPSILAQQYNTGQREISSSMFLSTITSFIVLALFIIIRGISI